MAEADSGGETVKTTPSGGRAAIRVPERQRPYDLALRLGCEALQAEPPSQAQLAALGACREAGGIRIRALTRDILVDPNTAAVLVDGTEPARPSWAVLAVHYLCAKDVAPDDREVSLTHFADCRGYLDVFAKRIVGRFLATTGRSAEAFVAAAESVGGARMPGNGIAYRFQVLPRLPLAIVRHEGDEEFPPGANVLYHADAQHLLPAEDRIVAAEVLLDTLSGKPIHDQGGGL